ncbi:MAG: hypothetical protein R3A52_23465 [Polyangiales bacterium]
MAYREAGAVSPHPPLASVSMRRVGRAFDLILGLIVAGFFVAAGVFYSSDTLSCRRAPDGAARCELSRFGALGRSGPLSPTRAPELRMPAATDEGSSPTLVFVFVSGESESLFTSASRGREVVAAWEGFAAGSRGGFSMVVSRHGLSVAAMLAGVGVMLGAMALLFPRGATARVFDDGRVEVETRRLLRAPSVVTYAAKSVREVRVDPQDDGDLAHLVFVIEGAPRVVFTGLPTELDRARDAIAPVIARLRGEG